MSSARGGSSARASRTKSRSQSPDSTPKDQPGLRTIVQQRILKDVFQHASEKYDGWKILVVDERSMRVISCAIGMYDIMERKVTLVESLDKKRAPFPDMGAIYLLEPTEESVSKMIEDFTAHAKPLYGNGIFLYFLRRLPDNLLNLIKGCKPLLKRLKALTEINIDFLAKEERAFIFDMKDSFNAFYLRKQMTPVERAIAQKLVTVCAALNEYPHIRYKQSSGICTSLASVFHLMMDEFVSQNPSWWYHGGPKKNQAAVRERGTLLILDRSDDCLTPLMHDFIYQSMVHDLLEMEGDRITYQAEMPSNPSENQAKDVLLDEKDSVWVDLRGNHIAKVIEVLSDRIRDIMNSSTGSAFGKGSQGNMSLSQMASALKALPEYREVMSKLSQHMHLAHQCMDILRKQNLMELSELEQTLATGKDDEGRSPKLNDLIDTAERLLRYMETPIAKVRLLMVLIISQGGLRSQDRLRLMNAAELGPDDVMYLNCLEVLGFPLEAGSEKKGLTALFGGGKVSGHAASDDDAEYAGMRYVSPLKQILDEMIYNSLSLEEYPSVLPMPDQGQSSARKPTAGSARSSRRGDASSARKSSGATSRWSKSSATDGKRSTGPANFTGGRSMVFMVGGMAFSEVCAARELMFKESREIVVGSTTFSSPTDFIKDLRTLKEGNSS